MDDLFKQWQNAPAESSGKSPDPGRIIEQAEQKKRKSRRFHTGNIAVLSATIVGLLVFFNTVAPVQEPLSLASVGVMIGGLLVRIIIEVISYRKLQQIDMTEDTLKANSQARQFYTFRDRIHGPVTIAIVLAYCVGVAMLIPEFSRYLTIKSLLIYYAGFVVWGLIMIVVIRKQIKKEAETLRELKGLTREG
ncbi:hypothetical protein AB9P05_05175 [Roseivirga sp. BDSF3-8]|uniref:hypothetical protein n=1 Tax=Roseivirga sp. BDSF3-8 TaxID=3241598 RepID=UPI0035323E2B